VHLGEREIRAWDGGAGHGREGSEGIRRKSERVGGIARGASRIRLRYGSDVDAAGVAAGAREKSV
jgi:hypothetical protein